MYYVHVPSERVRRGGGSANLLSQSSYTGRPLPPFVEEETPLTSSDMEGTDSHTHGHTGRKDFA
jgi:hypothetical protein